jgi:CDP-glucose 4,6-dehydratase
LVLAQALWDAPDCAAGWNFGPVEEDARPVGWMVERITELWPDELRWTLDDGPHPHEARYLKLDSSRARGRLGWRPPVALDEALASIVEWYLALREGADMRAVTLGQIESFSPVADSA